MKRTQQMKRRNAMQLSSDGLNKYLTHLLRDLPVGLLDVWNSSGHLSGLADAYAIINIPIKILSLV